MTQNKKKCTVQDDLMETNRSVSIAIYNFHRPEEINLIKQPVLRNIAGALFFLSKIM